jgi:hypothetical protein
MVLNGHQCYTDRGIHWRALQNLILPSTEDKLSASAAQMSRPYA